MEQLNFKRYPFTFKNKENKRYIFDIIRKKEILLTPEEWVRQHCLRFLMEEKKYPIGLINVEKKIEIFGKQKRYDIVVYTKTGTVAVLVECKAPKIEINQGVFDQIARYNLSVDSTYLMVTNGLKHVYCQMDYQAQAYHFLQDLPPYTVDK
ncbi:type I restriction enzyme HsdR N-terminal domain-containing protein [Flavobacteriaceae bacterium]|nr:type I restriction enzyme HsdR N-terminal domain-containing protein [Flavobacteriaceae bacterium]MDA9294297.1 type I restriction enzyme HsdR N-terminal domain-containing protein [Flavobacteriaceae bacterium]MDB2672931.1 type I restriction enzyme HsdR N-terminal domain-containing protein [Flavobacteriaceae bacterium]MDC1402575.1 type I restriction enzyme HsdR N-terminal domain-containing protein [Flavobacteriaceae bacterium]